MIIKVNYTVSDVYMSTSISPVYIKVVYSGTSGGGGTWGSITGTLSNQTDLQAALDAKFDDPTGTTAQYLRGDGSLATFPTIPSGTVTSVGLTMPVAFSVANSPITSSGTLAVTAIGTAAQYIRGDGQLATLPSNSSGGSSVAYYLNGSVAASVGTYYQMSKTPVIGTGTDFSLAGNGLIAQFLTDVADPNRLEIPAGNWNFEMYFNASSAGGTPAFYVELLKYNGTTFTSITSSSAIPEAITSGTLIDLYLTSLAIPQTTLLSTDRLAIRVYIVNSTAGRTITLNTENSHLCEIITNFAGGVSALNGLTANTQYFATGTSGTDFAISSLTDTHTFNLPTASGTNRGALSSADWTTFNNKQAALTLTTSGTSGAATLVGATLNIPQYSGGGGMAIGGAITSATAGSVLFAGTSGVLQQDNANLFWDDANNRLGIGTATPTKRLDIAGELIINSSTTNPVSTPNLSLNNTSASYGNNINFYSNNVINGYFRVDQSGNFGIEARGAIDFNYFGGLSDITFWRGVGIGGAGATIKNAILKNDTGNLLLGATSDTGFKLNVNGTAWINGSTTFGTLGTSTGMIWDNTNNRLGIGTTPSYDIHLVKNKNAETQIRIVNTTSGTSSFAGSLFVSNTTAGAFQVAKLSSTYTTYKTLVGADACIYNSTSGDFTFLNDWASGKCKWAMGGSSTAQMTLTAAGRLLLGTTTESTYILDVNGTARVSGTDLVLTGSNASGNPVRLSVTNTSSSGVADFFFFNSSGSFFGGQMFGSTASLSFANITNVNLAKFVTNAANFVIGTSASSPIIFAINATQSTGEVARFSTSGNLLLGRTNDLGYKLAITGDAHILGKLSVNTPTEASAIMEVSSSVQGFLPPRMTTTQKNAISSPAAGLIVYDTTLNKLCVRTASSWETITSL